MNQGRNAGRQKEFYPLDPLHFVASYTFDFDLHTYA